MFCILFSFFVRHISNKLLILFSFQICVSGILAILVTRPLMAQQLQNVMLTRNGAALR